jgi:hypothetical protein
MPARVAEMRTLMTREWRGRTEPQEDLQGLDDSGPVLLPRRLRIR